MSKEILDEDELELSHSEYNLISKIWNEGHGSSHVSSTSYDDVSHVTDLVVIRTGCTKDKAKELVEEYLDGCYDVGGSALYD